MFKIDFRDFLVKTIKFTTLQFIFLDFWVYFFDHEHRSLGPIFGWVFEINQLHSKKDLSLSSSYIVLLFCLSVPHIVLALPIDLFRLFPQWRQ